METLWNGGPLLEQAPGVFPMGTDSVILADFTRPGPRDRVLDLGTGSGILPILLACERPEMTVTAVDLDADACALAERNFLRNGLSDQVEVIQADLRNNPVPAGAFDLVISNPPYFREESGYVSPDLGGARSDRTCTLRELCGAAGRALRWGGSFCLVFRPERFCDLLAALRDFGMEPKRLRPVHHSPGKPVNLVLLAARRGGKPGLIWEPDLFLYHEDGSESAETKRIYRR